MDRARRAAVEELERASREHDAAHEDRLARFRNVETDTAELLCVLLHATRARRILELGTSNGYSTIWLADAAEEIGAKLRSVDVDSGRTALASANLASVGLDADLASVDAGAELRGSPDGAWDLIFLDAERDAYVGYWPDLLRALRPDGGLLAIDNAISHAHELVELSQLIESEDSVRSALAPCGAGLRLVVRGAPAS